VTYDYREVQKELGLYECGQCPRCGAKLHRCPFCGEKLCVACGWDEQAHSIESDNCGSERRELIDKIKEINEKVKNDPELIKRKQELYEELSKLTSEDLSKRITLNSDSIRKEPE